MPASKRSLLDLAQDLAEHRPEPFVAPVPDAARVDVFSLQGGVPYWFRVRDPRPGWHKLTPYSRAEASSSREAYPSEYLGYLKELPRFYVIAIFQASESAWICMPANSADAEQRGWPMGEPRQLHLVRGTLEPLSFVVARALSGTLLYERPYRYLDSPYRDFEQARLARAAHENEMRLLAHNRWMEELRGNTSADIEHRLKIAGAELVDWSEVTDGYRVTWEYNGAQHEVRVTRNMQVSSAGICLAGTDSRHDLATIVHTMERARVLRRFDMDEELYL